MGAARFYWHNWYYHEDLESKGNAMEGFPDQRKKVEQKRQDLGVWAKKGWCQGAKNQSGKLSRITLA
jgi:hypothetical protein